MRKTCTGIIVGVAVAVFLSALAAAQATRKAMSTFAVEILSGGCQGQRWRRRACANAI